VHSGISSRPCIVLLVGVPARRCHSLLLVHCGEPGGEPTSLQAVGEYRIKLPPPLSGSTGETAVISSSSSSRRI
jgi:hypothetical protein